MIIYLIIYQLKAIFEDDFENLQTYSYAGIDLPTVDNSRLHEEQDDFWAIGAGNLVADRLYVCFDGRRQNKLLAFFYRLFLAFENIDGRALALEEAGFRSDRTNLCPRAWNNRKS